MRPKPSRRRLLSPRGEFQHGTLWCVATSLLVLALAGCSQEDKIVVQNLPPVQENRPPTIVTYTPEFLPGGYERISSSAPQGLYVQVLVGDPDGLEDISLVAVDVDSVRLRRYLLRPDTSSTGCLRFSYATNDTVPTGAILAVPAKFPGLHLKPLQRSQGGLFILSNFGGYAFGFPDILGASANLKWWGGGCLYPNGFDYPYVVLPPVYPSERAATLTYAEVDYLGIRITVFDKVGASAVLPLPDLRIVFTTIEEKNAMP